MWNIRFWIFFAIVLILAGVVISIRKLRFIDVEVMIMIAALVMSCDMLFCKQFHLYTYISIEYKGWYSFWVNLFTIPLLGLIFIKFIPKNIKRVVVYIIIWAMIGTAFELFIAKPLGIVIYPKWNILLYSPMGYILVFSWVYIYYRILLKHYKNT